MKLSSVAVTVAACTLAVTACGSTVQTPSTLAGAGAPAQSGTGLGDAGAPGVGGGPAPAGGKASGSGGVGSAAGTGGPADLGQSGSSTQGAGGVSRSQAGSGSGTAQRVLGVTDKTIKFGASFATNQGETNAVLGAGQLDEGDARRFYDALAKQINDAGGVAGRRLVPSYFDATNYSDTATAMQAACETWTKDNPAFVIFDGNDDILRQCAKKAGIVSLSTGATNSTARTFAEYPHYFEPSSIRLERATRASVEGLAKTDYYGKAPVIGIITWDHPDYRRSVEGSMVPAVRRLGFTPTAPKYVKVPASERELGDSSASVNSAVLKMRSEGVTHVFIVDGPAGWFGGTGLTLLFIKSAGSQNWIPRYGFNDANNAEAGIEAGLWTAREIHDSRAVTASNALEGSDAGIAPNRQRIACLDLMKRNGVDTTNLQVRASALRACEYMWFVKRVLGSTFAPVNLDVFLGSVNSLGTSYASPYTYRTRFAADRHDAVAAARTMKLDENGCGCFVYTSGLFALP